MWGLGIFQAIMISVLSLRLRQLGALNDCNGRPSEALKDSIIKTQKGIKWLYVCTCIFYAVFAVLMIALSFPVSKALNDMWYYYLHVVQLCLVTISLVTGLYFMIRRVNGTKDWETQFASEKTIVKMTVILFAASYFLRIFFTIM